METNYKEHFVKLQHNPLSVRDQRNKTLLLRTLWMITNTLKREGRVLKPPLNGLLPLPDDPLGNQQPHNDQDNDDDKFSFIGKKIGHHDIHGLDSEGGPPICIDCHRNP